MGAGLACLAAHFVLHLLGKANPRCCAHGRSDTSSLLSHPDSGGAARKVPRGCERGDLGLVKGEARFRWAAVRCSQTQAGDTTGAVAFAHLYS